MQARPEDKSGEPHNQKGKRMTLYLEDLAQGEHFSFGSYPVTRQEVLEFASRYDPQAFHMDDEAAAANPLFGRLAASGWHTAAMVMRMTVDYWEQIGLRTLGAGGIDDMRWLRPVYPGDTLSAKVEITERRISRSQPDRGILVVQTVAYNQEDQPVMSHLARVFVPARPKE